MNAPPEPAALLAALSRARELGFLGPGPVEAHVDHAHGFGDVAEFVLGRTPRSFVDLGSGGGVPGLVLAVRWPSVRAVLVDANERRCGALVAAAAELGLTGRVEVAHGRGEELGRVPALRESFELATARGFAEPAVTAEIGSAFVAPAGLLVVSEPPSPGEDRWDEAGLERLGCGPAVPATARDRRFVAIRKLVGSPGAVPRGVGRPSKRPLW